MSSLKEKIVALRQKGYSLSMIVEAVGCSKSSASKHSKGIKCELNKKAKQRIADSAANASTASKKKWAENKKHAEHQAIEEWQVIKSDIEIMTFIAFYWAEGSKRSNKSLKITNSDPGIILSCLNSLEKLGVRRDECKLYISLFNSQSAHDAKKSWVDVTKITNVSVSVQQKRSSGRLYSKHGVATIYVKKSTEFFYKMMKWISLWRESLGLKEGWQL